eukprot:Plantae.Rhodophyta-Purpureofilum_apyrenoidigerum.ctg57108.p1 GENE.Plantae.Rhodophyta-Purpureofilum_apyrenoidigerum.ctg57108~~Plantae.Rhodophyta-Purpureofilum_apyrenoidigerum.ctg57108.p1  ORF type:complete len:290 (-),score=46.43 Plantae.Rhodophyta-Purpureofilum_apyrenoidigerum.ctg57108:112-897(-)
MNVLPPIVETCDDRNLVAAVVALCLRQLFERINRTREVAFSALQKISESGKMPRELTDIFSRVEDASGVSIFGNAELFLKAPSFRESVLTGLAFSAGGMGEVADLAADAMCSSVTAEELLRAYLNNRHHQRLSLPLITSLQTVLSRTFHDDAPWLRELANEVCKDLKGARDMRRIGTTIRILEELLTSTIAEQRCERALTNLLGHPIPRARRLAAEALYTHALLKDMPEELSDTLANTSWEVCRAADLVVAKELVSSLFNI